jgi:hypothetical protein
MKAVCMTEFFSWSLKQLERSVTCLTKAVQTHVTRTGHNLLPRALYFGYYDVLYKKTRTNRYLQETCLSVRGQKKKVKRMFFFESDGCSLNFVPEAYTRGKYKHVPGF